LGHFLPQFHLAGFLCLQFVSQILLSLCGVSGFVTWSSFRFLKRCTWFCFLCCYLNAIICWTWFQFLSFYLIKCIGSALHYIYYYHLLIFFIFIISVFFRISIFLINFSFILLNFSTRPWIDFYPSFIYFL
jgi:hypothetical protein